MNNIQVVRVSREVCKNCDLHLKPKDCSKEELVECEFISATKAYIEKFGIIAPFKYIISQMPNETKWNALKLLIESMETKKK